MLEPHWKRYFLLAISVSMILRAPNAGTVRQMSRVVHCLQKLMLRYIDPLKKSRKDARPMFATLDQFMGWLFTQTGRPQQRCSQQCMILFSALAPETSGEYYLASVCYLVVYIVTDPFVHSTNVTGAYSHCQEGCSGSAANG
jgi:hypothetical protein